jgi:hypothetical protein
MISESLQTWLDEVKEAAAARGYEAGKPQSSSADVLAIAASWERWVLRSDDPTEDNVDAF